MLHWFCDDHPRKAFARTIGQNLICSGNFLMEGRGAAIHKSALLKRDRYRMHLSCYISVRSFSSTGVHVAFSARRYCLLATAFHRPQSPLTGQKARSHSFHDDLTASVSASTSIFTFSYTLGKADVAWYFSRRGSYQFRS